MDVALLGVGFAAGAVTGAAVQALRERRVRTRFFWLLAKITTLATPP